MCRLQKTVFLRSLSLCLTYCKCSKTISSLLPSFPSSFLASRASCSAWHRESAHKMLVEWLRKWLNRENQLWPWGMASWTSWHSFSSFPWMTMATLCRGMEPPLALQVTVPITDAVDSQGRSQGPFVSDLPWIYYRFFLLLLNTHILNSIHIHNIVCTILNNKFTILTIFKCAFLWHKVPGCAAITTIHLQKFSSSSAETLYMLIST